MVTSFMLWREGVSRVVSIRYFTPAAPLRRYLSSYYWFESNDAIFSDLMRAELPQIRIVTCGKPTNSFINGHTRTPGPVHVQGPTTGSAKYSSVGPLHLFGVGVLPEGWSTLIGEPADRYADDVVDLSGVVGPSADTVFGDMLMARSDAERVAAADRFFLGLLAHAHATPRWFTALTDDWLTSSPNPDVDTLIEKSGMSARSVERLAKRIYGASPKMLSRKYRTLNAAVRLGNGEATGWADMAAHAYYDQPHFIREFKQFVGMTPSRFMIEAAPLMRLTIVRRTLLPEMHKLARYS
ncbi:MAG: AraC family transcriptional regulator [Alphaproteobacteria bacterium]|nr:MAG: AraC family transcriptional regulator [Alphaproteobacteria bacterium]